MKSNTGMLLDDPAAQDEFSGGSHSRAAKHLSRAVIELSNHETNRAIGLYGNWGSGKTTVVSFAETELSEHKTNFRFFTFDLWSANTAHFKRTLLEEMIDWASAQRPDIGSGLRKLRDRVRDREITTKTTPRFHFTKLGMLALFILPLIPIIYAWLGPEAFDQPKAIFEIEWVKTWLGEWAGVVTGWKLALLPLFTLAVIAFLSVLTEFFQNGWRFGDAMASVLALVVQREQTNIITQNVRENDPNDHEFDGLFRELLELLQSDNSKAVIVFDNIDRLDGSDMVDYWALVRSVFSSSDAKPARKNQSCVVIVPYVASAVRDGFANAQAGDNGNDLFAKTFDVLVRVAQPVLSDASVFLSKMITARFGSSLNEEEKSSIIEVYEFSKRQTSEAPVTPRELKTYVNEIADLHTMWGEEVPIAAIAIYARNRVKLEEDPNILRMDDTGIEGYYRFDASKQTLRYLACLAFNVHPDVAYQTLLTPEVISALSRADEDSLEKLEPIEGFAYVLREVSQYHASQIAGDGLASLALLTECAARHSNDEFRREQYALDLIKALPSLPKQGSWDKNSIECLIPILKALSGNDPDTVLRSISDLLSGPAETDVMFEAGQVWSRSVAQITATLNKCGFGTQQETLSYFDKPQDAEFALGVASTHGEFALDRKQLPKVFADRQIKDTIVGQVEIHTGKVPDIALGLVEAGKFGRATATSVLSSLKSGLAKDQVSEAENYLTWTKAFIETLPTSIQANRQGSQTEFEELIDGGAFVWHLHKFCENGENEALLAYGIFATLTRLGDQTYTKKPNTAVPTFSNFYQSSQWFDGILAGRTAVSNLVLEKAAELFAPSSIGDLIDVAKSSAPQSDLAKEILECAAKPNVQRGLKLVTFILRHETWLRDNSPSFLQAMIEDTKDQINDQDTKEASLDKVTPSLLTDALATGSADWVKYDEHVTALFDTLSEAEWNEVLRNRGNAHELLAAKFAGVGTSVANTIQSLRNPLEAYFLAVLEGGTEYSSKLGDQAFTLVGGALRGTIIRSITAKVASTTVTPEGLKRTYDLFPETLGLVLAEDTFGTTVDIFMSSLLASGNSSIIDVLENYADVLARHIAELDESRKTAVSASFLALVHSGLSRDALEGLAEKLGLPVEFPEEETVEADNDQHNQVT